jgi:endonuclease/exonuclease/phosphatase family metal-dependent hydrolase
LTELGNFIKNTSNAANPSVIMGDLNIPGEIKEHYDQLINRLGVPVDLWIAKNMQSEDGFTWTEDNSFYSNLDDVPDHNSRLDYILLKPGLTFVPILNDIEILRWTHANRHISDHFGLFGKFTQDYE